MPMPIFPPLHIRPFLLGNDGKASRTSVTAPLGVAKRLKTPNTEIAGLNFNAGGAKGSYDSANILPVSNKMPDKLGSIHSKLFAEAEKIQKWKTSIEIEQQQKEKKLQDTYRIVDSLRKEILDLQLQNENLSMKLTDDMQNRNDVLQKQQSTRELCVALKKHFVGLEERIEYAERVKENFEMIENRRLKTFEDLAEKFEALQLSHMEQVQTFNNIITSREREMDALRDECNSQLSEANKQLQYLIEVRDAKEHDIMKISSELRDKAMLCDNIALEKKQLLLEVSGLKESNNMFSFQLQETNEHMCKIQTEKSELETQYALAQNHLSELQHINTELKDQFLKYQKESEENITSLKIDLKDATMKLSEEKQNVTKQQAIVDDHENLIKSLRENEVLLQQQMVQIKKDVQTEKQEKINGLEEELKSVCKERDDFSIMFDHVKKCLSEKESMCTSLHTEISAKEKMIETLRIQNYDLQLQIKDLSSQEKVKVQKLEDKLKCFCDEKDHLSKEFEQTKLLLAVKESLCESLNAELDDKQIEISSLAAKNNKLEMQVKDLFADKDVASNHEESLKEELGITEKRYLELCSVKDELERKLKEKDKQLADTAVENETKIRKLEASIEAKEEEVNKLEASIEGKEEEINKLEARIEAKEEEINKLNNCIEAKEEEINKLNASIEAKEEEINKLNASIEAKEEEMNKLENHLSNLYSDLSEEQTKSQSFLSALEESKHEIGEMQVKLELLERTQDELEKEYSEYKNTLCEVQAEKESASVALEEEKKKLTSLEEVMTEKDSTIVLLESKITSMESKINDLVEEKSNQKEAHALQIRDMLLQNEKSQELIALHEKSQNDYRKDSIEKERKLQSLQSKIQKLENQIRFENRQSEVESLKSENLHLKGLLEKLKADLEKKKKNEVSAKSVPGKTILTFKAVEDQDSSASETVEIELQNVNQSAKVSLPQKRVGIGRPMKAATRQTMGRNFGIQNSGNKKIKLGGNKTDQNILGNKSIEEKRKTAHTRKFFKSSHSSPAQQNQPNLSWFDLDPTYGFFE